MSSEPIVIDDAVDRRQFVASEWIGCGKTYPSKDTPEFILAARKATLAIPPGYASLLPKKDMSVHELLQLNLPHQPASVITARADRAFSFEEPNEALTRRMKVFGQQGVPLVKELADARVGVTSAVTNREPLAAGSYGIIIHKDRLYVAHVLTIYSRGGGKAGAHAWQSEVNNIGLVSYIVAQVYEHSFNTRFCAIHHDLAMLQTNRILHLSSDFFLVSLSRGNVTISPDHRNLELDGAAYIVFQQLATLARLVKAVKLLAKARRNTKDAEKDL